MEADLIRVMRQRSDLTALRDVTDPVPSIPQSELWTLPNIIISPHIGGVVGDEVVRLADYVIRRNCCGMWLRESSPTLRARLNGWICCRHLLTRVKSARRSVAVREPRRTPQESKQAAVRPPVRVKSWNVTLAGKNSNICLLSIAS